MSDYTTDHDLQAYEDMSCGHECHYTEEYGFVPEAGCPIHDKLIPYDVSNWKKIGQERGYWSYFKTEVINEYLLEAKNAVKVK